MPATRALWGLASEGQPRPTREAGFTLLELILAITLTGLVLGVSYEAYLGSLKNVRSGSGEIDCNQTGRAVLQSVADDVRSAILTGGLFAYGLRGTDGGESDLLSDTLELTCSAALRWREPPTSFTDDPLPPRTDFQEVVYRVITPEEAAQAGTDTGIRPAVGLVREVRPNLLVREATAGDAASSARHSEILSRSVVAIQFQYHDGSGWLDAWDAAGQGGMPLAVRITVFVLRSEKDLVGPDGLPPDGATVAEAYLDARRFTTVVSVPTAVIPEGTRIIQ